MSNKSSNHPFALVSTCATSTTDKIIVVVIMMMMMIIMIIIIIIIIILIIIMIYKSNMSAFRLSSLSVISLLLSKK